MAAITQKLDYKLETRDAKKAVEGAKMISEVIEMTDSDCVDLLPARRIIQDVLDALDKS